MGHRSRQDVPVVKGLVLLLPLVLLAACGLGTSPEARLEEPPLPPKPPSAAEENKANAPAPTPALAPLATQQQVVKAVKVGRRDPFAAVLLPTLVSTPDAQRQTASKTGGKAALTPSAAPLAWPNGLEFEGVLQTASESEAMVRYTPVAPQGGGTRSGSVRVGDEGTRREDSLLPPGWQVGAIDGERGILVLRKGGQAVSRGL
ncbi:MAG: hypothetical protein ACK6AD_13025 [Cyanobacteriota bacterium]